MSRAVALGFNVLFTDMDVVWLRDPLAYMRDKVGCGVCAAGCVRVAVAWVHVCACGVAQASPGLYEGQGVWWCCLCDGGGRVVGCCPA